MKFTEYIKKLDEGKEDKVIKDIEKANTSKQLIDIRDTIFFKMDLNDKIKGKIKQALDAKMKSVQLREERIHSKDKRAIIAYMGQPKNEQYKMKDGEILKVNPVSGGVEFLFNKDNFELSMTIVDLADALPEYKVSKTSPGKIIIKQA